MRAVVIAEDRSLQLGDVEERPLVRDGVAVYPFAPCGECPMCRAGHVHVCAQAATAGVGRRPRGAWCRWGVLEEPSPIVTLVLLVKEAELRASFAYRPEEFDEAIELLRAGRIPAAELVTGTFPLADADRLVAELVRPETEHRKVVLTP